MIKKLLSKKGFTIVEVMVAFVIFAIMAAMVCTIVNTTMQVKQENNDIEDEIKGQRDVYYGNTQDLTYADNGQKLTFNFDGISPVNVGYNIGNPNPPPSPTSTEEASGMALEYFIGNVDYNALKNPAADRNDSSGDKVGGSATNRFGSVGIYGSNGVTDVEIYAAKDESDDTGRTYFFALKAQALGETSTQYDMFKQVRLLFPSNIVEFGYCRYQIVGNIFRDKGTYAANYQVNKTNPNTLRIANTQVADTPPLIDQGYVAFYVTLADKLPDSLNLYEVFGYSSTSHNITSKDTDGEFTDSTTPQSAAGGVYNFVRYQEETKDEDGNDTIIEHVNIFAATEKPKADPDAPET